jgi:glycolate oxidase FAD binding subunit
MTDNAVASENEIVEAVRSARAAKSPLEIVGGRSKRNLGRPPSHVQSVLDVSALRGIVAYEPEELIITVLPGTPIVEIEAALAEKGQRLGFDPPDWGPLLGAPAGMSTIGGVISADTCGPGRVRYGAVRDQLLGFRAVNGLGEAFKAGGKVVKNVTGFDIPKLVCGAFGTLCVLTEVTLRVFPKPSRSQTFALSNVAPDEAFAVLRKIWSSPLEATGLACSRDSVLIRLEGEKEPLAEKFAMLRSLCGAADIRTVDDGDGAFRSIGDGEAFLGSSDNVWRIAIPAANAAAVVNQIKSRLWVGDWAGGLLWIETNEAERLRDIAKAAGGYAVLMRAAPGVRAGIDVFEKEDPVRAQLTRSVKAAFDPLGLFNPGRMWDGV